MKIHSLGHCTRPKRRKCLLVQSIAPSKNAQEDSLSVLFFSTNWAAQEDMYHYVAQSRRVHNHAASATDYFSPTQLPNILRPTGNEQPSLFLIGRTDVSFNVRIDYFSPTQSQNISRQTQIEQPSLLLIGRTGVSDRIKVEHSCAMA